MTVEPPVIQLTLDGSIIHAREGQSIVAAARENGIDVPTLCDHPILPPAGTCRICLVQVGGRIVTACTTPVASGMAVAWMTSDLEQLRRGVVELLMAEGHHVCQGCEKAERCDLQSLARRYGVDSVMGRDVDQDAASRSALPHLMLHHDRCIQCLRCVRAIKGHQGQDIFGFVGQGRSIRIAVDVTDADALSDDTAQRAEAVCPVGALIHRRALAPAITRGGT